MFTIEDLVSLKEALVSGASTVQVGGRMITYRSKKELLELIRLVEDDLNGTADDDCNSSVVVAGFDKKGRRRHE